MNDSVDAYTCAIQFLSVGAMPVIVEAPDGLHVLSVFPTSREAACCMEHEDGDERMKFLVRTMVACKNAIEQACA